MDGECRAGSTFGHSSILSPNSYRHRWQSCLMSQRQQPFDTNLFAHRPFRYGDLTITYCMNRHWQLFKNTFWNSRMRLVRDALSVLSVSWWPPTFPIDWAEIRQSSWIVGLSARLLRHFIRSQQLPFPVTDAFASLQRSSFQALQCKASIRGLSSAAPVHDKSVMYCNVPEWRSYFLIDSWMGQVTFHARSLSLSNTTSQLLYSLAYL